VYLEADLGMLCTVCANFTAELNAEGGVHVRKGGISVSPSFLFCVSGRYTIMIKQFSNAMSSHDAQHSILAFSHLRPRLSMQYVAIIQQPYSPLTTYNILALPCPLQSPCLSGYHSLPAQHTQQQQALPHRPCSCRWNSLCDSMGRP